MTRLERMRRIQRRRRRVRMCVKLLTLLVICLAPFFLLKATAAMEDDIIVSMTVKDGEMLQGQEIPAFEPSVTLVEGRSDTRLEKSGYTVQDFIKDLEKEDTWTVQSDVDVNEEGTYSVDIQLKKDVLNKISERWLGRVQVVTKPARLVVKNAVGQWDGKKFKKYDGSYIKKDFVVSKNKTYYFDGDGNKVTGWQEIKGSYYYFNKKGAMAKNTWMDHEDSKSYIGKNGKAVIGWYTEDDKEYYFDEKGLMQTGTLRLGMTEYQFDGQGVLVSQEVKGIDKDKPMVALTFDDGPGKRTGELLAQLKKYNAHATFFMLGQNVSAYQDEVKEMKKIGCELGNHSYSHANLGKAGEDVIKKEVEDTNAKIKKIAGQEATVMRPPYGSISSTLRENVGMPMILWNIDTLDWKTKNAKSTIDEVMNNAKDGDIILMHDIHSTTIDAALELIPKLQEAGFQLVTVSELAAARGEILKDGEKYTDF